MGEVMNSTVLIVQMSITVMWAAMLVLHTRRLLRLSRVIAFAAPRQHVLRHRLRRAWWWLGREEFWTDVQRDSRRCMLLTMMLVLLAWGIA
jgi:hypothetical protein